jgi:hypothetical protein
MPIVIPSISSALPRRSAANCCRLLADRINSLTLATTDATASDTKSLVSSGLSLAINDQNRYRGHWVYVYNGAQGGQTRRVGDNALSTTNGRLAIGPTAFAAPIGSGVTVELHQKLPPRTGLDGMTGLLDCLNHALREVWVLDRLTVAAVSNQPGYDLGGLFNGLADWLDPDAIIEFYGPQVASALNVVPWGGWNAIQDAENIQLQVSPGLTSGQSTTLEITRPGNTYMRLSGVWTDNQDGFSHDSDESLFRPDRLVDVALVYAYRALAFGSSGTEKAMWDAQAMQQRRTVNYWKRTSLPHPSGRSMAQRSLYAGGSSIYSYGDAKSCW